MLLLLLPPVRLLPHAGHLASCIQKHPYASHAHMPRSDLTSEPSLEGKGYIKGAFRASHSDCRRIDAAWGLCLNQGPSWLAELRTRVNCAVYIEPDTLYPGPANVPPWPLGDADNYYLPRAGYRGRRTEYTVRRKLARSLYQGSCRTRVRSILKAGMGMRKRQRENRKQALTRETTKNVLD